MILFSYSSNKYNYHKLRQNEFLMNLNCFQLMIVFFIFHDLNQLSDECDYY